MARLLEVTYTRSAIGRNSRQRRTVKALGLHRLHETVRHNDTPEVRGMVNSVRHLIAWREIDEERADETA
ncbi:MAG TPA: 50S ribosomal protein L30 [Chloroflexota bacterium]|nr:50S ribosomal protein L30 [Chloroflexota bacterium]